MAENNLVLYRKYRPTKLEDVVGQEQITHVLANAIRQGKIAHAYLFIGPRGTGKTSVARIFAHAINGFDYQVEDNYLDIIEIDAASNTGVDNIRELREKAIIAPTKGKYKVYIIDEVHMLTKSASNALLKTLEEPPEHVVFIMATTDAHKVPITISSRTQVHTFKLAEPEIMQQHLRKISDQEGIKITDDALGVLVRRGGGSFRDSLSLLDQIASLSDQEITAEMLTSALGLPQEQAISELLAAYTSQDGAVIHKLLQNLFNTGIKPEVLASEIIQAIIEKPETTLLPLLAALPEVQPPFPEAKLLLAFLSPSQSLAPSQPTSTPTALKTPENSLKRKIPAKKPATKSSKGSILGPQTTTEQPSELPQETSETPLKASDTPKEFNWERFLEQIHELNNAIYSQLQKVSYRLDGSTLHLYPTHKFTKSILEKPGNRQIMRQVLPNIAVAVHEPGEQTQPKDPALSQISAIMGNIQEVNGDAPF